MTGVNKYLQTNKHAMDIVCYEAMGQPGQPLHGFRGFHDVTCQRQDVAYK